MNEKEKHKLAEKKKKEGESLLNQLGLSLNSDLISIGIIFENLLKSDMNIAGLNSINAIFNGFVGVDLNVFVHNLGTCCVFLLAPLLDLKYIFSWEYPLITTSKSTLQTALNSRSQNIYYYDWYNNEKDIDDSRIKIINRKTVDNFDLVKIIKIIVDDLKNEKK